MRYRGEEAEDRAHGIDGSRKGRHGAGPDVGGPVDPAKARISGGAQTVPGGGCVKRTRREKNRKPEMRRVSKDWGTFRRTAEKLPFWYGFSAKCNAELLSEVVAVAPQEVIVLRLVLECQSI